MGQHERRVEICGRDFRIVGNDGDSYAENLPPVVHELTLEYAAATLPDDAITLDIGANLGLVTIGLGLLAPRGRVIAVEPSPDLFPNLERNVASARLRNVTLINAAASESPGALEFFPNTWFSAGSFVKESTIAADVHDGAVTVPAVTIDATVEELGLERIDLIKIDVEGHELPALRGASETLRRFEPSAIIEMNLFATTSFGNTLPLDYLSTICAIFPYVYDYRFEVGLFPIRSEADMYGRVQSQYLTGLPTDLICRFEPLPDAATERLLGAVHVATEPDPPGTDLELALARTRDALEQTRGDLAAARRETASLRESTSWKLTAPGRWLSDRVAGLRRHPEPT